jgi:hypothetical protein
MQFRRVTAAGTHDGRGARGCTAVCVVRTDGATQGTGRAAGVPARTVLVHLYLHRLHQHQHCVRKLALTCGRASAAAAAAAAPLTHACTHSADVDDDPVNVDPVLREVGWRCVATDGCAAVLDPRTPVCRRCRLPHPAPDVARAALARSAELVRAATALLDSLDPAAGLAGAHAVGARATVLLREAVDLRSRWLHPTSRQLGSTHDALARAYVTCGTTGDTHGEGAATARR